MKKFKAPIILASLLIMLLSACCSKEATANKYTAKGINLNKSRACCDLNLKYEIGSGYTQINSKLGIMGKAITRATTVDGTVWYNNLGLNFRYAWSDDWDTTYNGLYQETSSVDNLTVVALLYKKDFGTLRTFVGVGYSSFKDKGHKASLSRDSAWAETDADISYIFGAGYHINKNTLIKMQYEQHYNKSKHLDRLLGANVTTSISLILVHKF